jgi:hypothetical protein
MKADKNFDFYEFAGIVMPGAVLIFGLAQAETLIAQKIPMSDMSLGSLGVFLILAYAAGHLVQTLGGLLEKAWWYKHGMPSDWILKNEFKLISSAQRSALVSQLPAKLGLSEQIDLSTIKQGEWFGYVRQMYAAVAAKSRASRIDTFNGNYGLNRGLCVSLILVAIVALVKAPSNWGTVVLLVVGAVLAAFRMHRFGKHYARELLVQFLQLPMPSSGDEDKSNQKNSEDAGTSAKEDKDNG